MSAVPSAAPAMGAVAWATILAPLVAVAFRFMLPVPGYLILGFLLTSPLWLASYALLVTAVARGMLIRAGVLRAERHRARAAAWALLSSAGVLAFAVALPDFTGSYWHSGLTLVFGSPTSWSPIHDVSVAVTVVTGGLWLFGYVALVLEYLVARRRFRRSQPRAPRVAPPVVWQDG